MKAVQNCNGFIVCIFNAVVHLYAYFDEIKKVKMLLRDCTDINDINDKYPTNLLYLYPQVNALAIKFKIVKKII